MESLSERLWEAMRKRHPRHGKSYLQKLLREVDELAEAKAELERQLEGARLDINLLQRCRILAMEGKTGEASKLYSDYFALAGNAEKHLHQLTTRLSSALQLIDDKLSGPGEVDEEALLDGIIGTLSGDLPGETLDQSVERRR